MIRRNSAGIERYVESKLISTSFHNLLDNAFRYAVYQCEKERIDFSSPEFDRTCHKIRDSAIRMAYDRLQTYHQEFVIPLVPDREIKKSVKEGIYGSFW